MRGARARVQAGGRAHIKRKRVAPRLEAALFYRTSALSSNVQRRSPARSPHAARARGDVTLMLAASPSHRGDLLVVERASSFYRARPATLKRPRASCLCGLDYLDGDAQK